MLNRIKFFAALTILLMLTFSCSIEDSDNTVTDIDGNLYHTVKIGNQEWMVENLKTTKYNDGTSIPFVSNSIYWEDYTSPAYCWYNNDTANKNTYGALYNWYTIETGKLAPTGWHIPTDIEWTILVNYLIANNFNYDGTTTGNKVAKAMAAKVRWTTTTFTGAIGNDLTKNNASGFTGLPGGFCYHSGNFVDIGNYAYWWSSTESNNGGSWYRSLCFLDESVEKLYYSKQNGFSVRCIRD